MFTLKSFLYFSQGLVFSLPARTPLVCLTFQRPYIKMKAILHKSRFVSKDMSTCILYLLAFDGCSFFGWNVDLFQRGLAGMWAGGFRG